MVIKGVRFHQINNIESVRFSRFRVRDSEIVPLRITSRIIVRLQNKVIFILVDLDGSAKISRLKARLEEECVVIGTNRDVKWWNFTFRGGCLLIVR